MNLGGKSFDCYLCMDSCESRESLEIHLLAVHGEVDTEYPIESPRGACKKVFGPDPQVKQGWLGIEFDLTLDFKLFKIKQQWLSIYPFIRNIK